MFTRRNACTCALALVLCLAFTGFVYAPGLAGNFLFDDFANLPALGATGPVDNWPTFWRYITSGRADPTGRPLALLTFLADAHNWPADPYPFLRSNLLLHLFNGGLLALLLRRLGREAFKHASARRLDFAAVLGASFWLLHPLFVSTTLYIVQREAMLPATFTLLGLLAWLRGRHALASGKTGSGLFWIALGLGGCTVLGVLSKANGALLPALALVIEYVLLRSKAAHPVSASEQASSTRTYQRSMLLFGWLPATAVTGYLLYRGWSGLVHGISSVRPWTLGQRLLTEPRVLMDYLDLLWLPRPFTPGLFNDHIAASTSLWAPVTTLPALLAVAALIVGAWRLRQRWPAAALAILFFFVGQSLESSTIPLELYFEHRNYLPALLMFWPLALWLCDIRTAPSSLHPDTPVDAAAGALNASARIHTDRVTATTLKLVLAVLLLAGLGWMTHARASLWGNSHEQALLWATLNPNSSRAQANAAQVETKAGHPERAIKRLNDPLARSPEQIQLALNLIDAECRAGQIHDATLNVTRAALSQTRDPGALLLGWFDRAMEQVAHAPCRQLTYAMLTDLLHTAQGNSNLSKIPGRRQDIHHLLGRIALLQGDANTALAEFNRALDANARPATALKQAALLGTSGFPRQGLRHLDHLEAGSAPTLAPRPGMPRIHAWVLQQQHYWPKEQAYLRATLLEDARQQARTAE